MKLWARQEAYLAYSNIVLIKYHFVTLVFMIFFKISVHILWLRTEYLQRYFIA